MTILFETSQTTAATEQRPQLAPLKHCTHGFLFGLSPRRSNLLLVREDLQDGLCGRSSSLATECSCARYVVASGSASLGRSAPFRELWPRRKKHAIVQKAMWPNIYRVPITQTTQ
jgi:hypothetical protein